jgi:hypothetical protein
MFKNRYFATECNIQQTRKYTPIRMRDHIPKKPSLLIIGEFNYAFCGAHFTQIMVTHNEVQGIWLKGA